MNIWTKPQYSRRHVNRAGEILLDPTTESEIVEALKVINNWRASHQFPLNTLQVRLRRLARTIDGSALVAQRIKRLSSIRSKLIRIPGLNLVQIQDIGGCRAIVDTISSVDSLLDLYRHDSRGVKHNLVSEDNYISFPKESGYRSAHLVYQYRSDKSKDFENLKIEIQIRTRLQHAWATAVETIDTFTVQDLKSGYGNEKWKRFFVLISCAMAYRENRPICPNVFDDKELIRQEIIQLEKELNVRNSLTAFRTTLAASSNDVWSAKAYYYVLELDPDLRNTNVRWYRQTDSKRASEEYLRLEEKNANTPRNVVLVSADSLDALKLAFPNYYLDTHSFVQFLDEVINGGGQLRLFG